MKTNVHLSYCLSPFILCYFLTTTITIFFKMYTCLDHLAYNFSVAFLKVPLLKLSFQTYKSNSLDFVFKVLKASYLENNNADKSNCNIPSKLTLYTMYPSYNSILNQTFKIRLEFYEHHYKLKELLYSIIYEYFHRLNK